MYLMLFMVLSGVQVKVWVAGSGSREAGGFASSPQNGEVQRTLNANPAANADLVMILLLCFEECFQMPVSTAMVRYEFPFPKSKS